MSDIEVVAIRYDGLDAERHEIELMALGGSLQGIARVLAMAGHFAVTGKVSNQLPSLDVRVVAHEDPKPNCFTVHAALQFAAQHGIFQGIAAAVIGPIIAYIIAKAANDHAQMKHLRGALDKAIDKMAEGNAATIERLARALELLADQSRPALRDAVQPVGRTCATMRIGPYALVDEPTAQAIREESPQEILDERQYDVLITELDLENRTAKVRLLADGLESRIRAEVTDPVLSMAGNPYTRSFMEQTPLQVSAKAGIRDGVVSKLFISNSAGI